jgi:hypothetical protein
VAKPHYVDDVIDTRYTPLEHIQSFITGTPVYFNMYQQVVTTQTDLREPQVTTSGGTTVNQQYRKISRIELRQSDSFSVDYDASSGSFNIDGDLNFYPRVVPNKFDILIGDIGLGKGAIFIIDDATPLNYTVQRGHSVKIKFLAELSNKNLVDYLEQHTIERYRFNADYLRLGKDPLMTTNAFDVMRRMENARREVISRFMGKFFDRNLRAPVLVHSGRKVYDPLLSSAIKDLCEREEHPSLRELFLRSTDEGPELEIPTIWNCLVECNENMWYAIADQMWVLHRNVFGRYVTMHGIRYSNIDYMIYPKGQESGFGNGVDLYELSKTPLQIAISQFIFDLDDDTPGTPTDVTDIPLSELADSPLAKLQFPDLTSDPYYVLSGAFYNKQPQHQTFIEREVGKMLRQEKLDLEGVIDLCDALKSRPAIEQYYYSVVMLALTRYGINHSY